MAFKDACGPAHLKVILGTGDLLTLRNVAKASLVAMMAGADFIKTSTGKEAVNATLPVGLVMTRAIREYAQETGMAVGFKPAGGIRTAKQSLEWLALMKEELGRLVAAVRIFFASAPAACSPTSSANSNFTPPAATRRNIATRWPENEFARRWSRGPSGFAAADDLISA